MPFTLIPIQYSICNICMSSLIQSFLIGLTRFSFHLTDVAIHLTDVSFQLTDISLQLTEALLYKFGVNLKQNPKAKTNFSQRALFSNAFLLHPWTKDA